MRIFSSNFTFQECLSSLGSAMVVGSSACGNRSETGISFTDSSRLTALYSIGNLSHFLINEPPLDWLPKVRREIAASSREVADFVWIGFGKV